MILIRKSQKGDTVLDKASAGGHHEVVRLLIDRGEDPNTHDKVRAVTM